MGIRPATPGTVVVLAGTICLTLASVSVPLLKNIFFLGATVSATVGGTSVGGDITIGCWGYCVGSTCSAAKLGYTLDVESLFNVNSNGLVNLTGISSSLVRWLTYVLILHPVAAAFGLIATILGLLAHIREFQGTGFTTCFASIGGSVGILVFIFDIILFIIAQKRINSSDVGGNARLGSAIWLTLAGSLLLATSGIFFGCGRCLVRNNKREKQASERMRPSVDPEYGKEMRESALRPSRKEGQLPAFTELQQETIPLTSIQAQQHHEAYQDEEDHLRRPPQSRISDSQTHGSLVNGVGYGYGRRAPLQPSSNSHNGGLAAVAAGGAGAAALAARNGRNNSQFASTSAAPEPFVGMSGTPPPSSSPPPRHPNLPPLSPTGSSGAPQLPVIGRVASPAASFATAGQAGFGTAGIAAAHGVASSPPPMPASQGSYGYGQGYQPDASYQHSGQQAYAGGYGGDNDRDYGYSSQDQAGYAYDPPAQQQGYDSGYQQPYNSSGYGHYDQPQASSSSYAPVAAAAAVGAGAAAAAGYGHYAGTSQSPVAQSKAAEADPHRLYVQNPSSSSSQQHSQYGSANEQEEEEPAPSYNDDLAAGYSAPPPQDEKTRTGTAAYAGQQGQQSHQLGRASTSTFGGALQGPFVDSAGDEGGYESDQRTYARTPMSWEQQGQSSQPAGTRTTEDFYAPASQSREDEIRNAQGWAFEKGQQRQ